MKKVLGLSALTLLLGVTGASARSVPSARALQYPDKAWYQMAPGACGYYPYNFRRPSTPPIDPFHFSD
ncbi:MAG: hypothetical protein WBX25_19235 [Rhodomicrobium sp.]